MITDFVKQGIDAIHEKFDAYESIHGEQGLGLELTIQINHLKTIGQALEGIETSKALENLPVEFVRDMGYLVQFHAGLSQSLSEAIQSSVQEGVSHE